MTASCNDYQTQRVHLSEAAHFPPTLRMFTRWLLALVAFVVIAAWPSGAQAGHGDWLGTFSGFWTTAANWDIDLPPGPGDTASFQDISLGEGVVRSNITLDQDRTVAAMLVDGRPLVGFYSFTQTNGAILTVSGTTALQYSGSSADSVFFDGFLLKTNAFNVFNSVGVAIKGNASISSNITHFQNNSLVQVSGATLNTGALAVFDSAELDVLAGGLLTTGSTESELQNSSKVHIVSSGTFNAGGDLKILGGSFTLDGGSNFSMPSGHTLTATGTASKIALNRGFAVDSGATLSALSGGQIIGVSYIDIGNAKVGTLSLDGAGTILSTAGPLESDWGAGAAGSFTGTLSHGAAANLSVLALGVSDGAASLSLLSGSSLNAGSFNMGGGAAARTVSLTINGGALKVNGNAIFANQATVQLQSGSMTFAADASILTGATINWTGGAIDSTGVFLNVAGGTLNRNGVLGELSNGGTLNVTGAGQFTGTNFYDVANTSATGTLLVDGVGTLYTAGSTSDWGRNAGHTANVTVSNSAQANLNILEIGTHDASASVSVSGGATLSTASTLAVGGGPTARTVSLDVTGGTLTTNGAAIFDNHATLTLGTGGTINFNGAATFLAGSNFNWNAGTLNIAANQTLSVSGGTLIRNAPGGPLSPNATLSISNGGKLTSANNFGIGIGTLNVANAGSSITVNGSSPTNWAPNAGNKTTVNLTDSGTATYTGLQMGSNGGTTHLTINTGGRLNASSLSVGGAATININDAETAINVGGPVTLAKSATINLTSGGILVDGALSLTDNARILAAAPTSAGAIVARSLSMNGATKIDVGSGILAIDYSGASPVSSIRGLIHAGFNGGDWQGNGISSSAADSTKIGVGYIDSKGQIGVTKALYGDANLDRTVGFADLVAVAQNYNGTGKTWSQGDFNYDGIVDFSDLVKVAQHYNQSLPAGAVAALGNDFASDFAHVQAMVPEPNALAFVVSILSLKFYRRRR